MKDNKHIIDMVETGAVALVCVCAVLALICLIWAAWLPMRIFLTVIVAVVLLLALAEWLVPDWKRRGE